MVEIVKKSKCVGCSACKLICPKKAIKMEPNQETGFIYPAINESLCINCGLCKKVCPVLKTYNNEIEKKVMAAYSVDENIRKNSSSGGIFSLLAEKVISQEGIVFGVGMSKDCVKAEHISVESICDLGKLRGSKYLQSDLGDTFLNIKKALIDKKKVLFSGTPCQIAGLKAFLGKDYENLITVDFICHGVPSPLVWHKYVKYREMKANSETREIFFRYKKNGWKKFFVKFVFESGEKYEQIVSKDLYMRGFLTDLYLRRSCFDCKFKNDNYKSDITLADFWGIDKVVPEWNDDKGVSVVVSNTKKGLSTLKSIKGNINCRAADFKDLFMYNPSYFKSVNKKFVDKIIYKDFNRLAFDDFIYKYCGVSIFCKVRRRLHLLTCAIFKRFNFDE